MNLLVVIIGLLALAGTLVWFAIPLAVRRWQTARLRRLCRERRAIVLSYDDGPGRQVTPALCDLLAGRGCRATFFVVGRAATAAPAMIARLLADGHEIGNHTQDHLNAWKSLPWAAVKDIRAGRRSLDRLGVPAGPFRPPYGKMTLATLAEVRQTAQPTVFWTIDSRDSWEAPRPVPEVLAALEAEGGGVVLMHDIDRPPRAEAGHDHAAHVLTLTAAILDLAERKGFAILRHCDLEGGHDADR